MKQNETTAERKQDFNSSVNQDIKGKFIGQHVYCNVNSLVEYCLNKGFEDRESPVNFDDLENFYSYPEWSKKVLDENLYFEGGSEDDKETFAEIFDGLIQESETLLSNEEISESTHERNVSIVEQAREEFQNATEDSEPAEVYEWWAVSSYLFGKLKEQGQVVIDAGSCYVWGRQTTGQAILLDGIISRICSSMEILDGQPNSWAKS